MTIHFQSGYLFAQIKTGRFSTSQPPDSTTTTAETRVVGRSLEDNEEILISD